jgi:hypothetical protein
MKIDKKRLLNEEDNLLNSPKIQNMIKQREISNIRKRKIPFKKGKTFSSDVILNKNNEKHIPLKEFDKIIKLFSQYGNKLNPSFKIQQLELTTNGNNVYKINAKQITEIQTYENKPYIIIKYLDKNNQRQIITIELNDKEIFIDPFSIELAGIAIKQGEHEYIKYHGEDIPSELELKHQRYGKTKEDFKNENMKKQDIIITISYEK